MQIIGLHKNVYKLYAWARTQECLDAYRIKYEDRVRHWEALRAEYPSWSRPDFGPFSVFVDQRICQNNEFSHDHR